MFGIGAWELTIILLIVLVLFGGKRLPSVATGLGQAIRNFRSALKGESEEISGHLSGKNPQNETDHSKSSS